MGDHTTPRRVPTYAERIAEARADGSALRQVADTRPGYATYPQTRPGDPSWWRRSVLRPEDPAETERWERDKQHPGPAPVDGETCAKWCGFCHLHAGEPEPAPVADAASAVGRVLSEHLPAIGEALAEIVRPPRRRWWHRLTRRG